jgi:capsid protein
MSRRKTLKNRLPQASSNGAANLGYSFTSSNNLYPSPADTNLRGWRPNLDRDVWAMLPQARHVAMISDARYIYGGNGSVSGAISKKADYAIGWSWSLTYTGTNETFRRVAQPLMERWTRLCDVRGGLHDWRLGLRNASIAIDRDGDCFAVLTRTEEGSPRIQWLEGHRVGTPWVGYGQSSTVVPEVEGTRGYAGMTILSGVIYDEYMRPVGYNLTDGDFKIGQEAKWNIIPASSVVPFQDPHWFSQSRGIPSIISAILDWYDIGETREAEKIAVKANSAIAIVEKNETGRREIGREAVGAGGGPAAGRQGLQTQMFEKGLIRYIKSSGDISAHSSNRPGPAWQGFIDYITRGAFAGMDLPYEFVWNSADIGGAGIRSMVGQVQRSIENRQAVMYQPAMQIALWAVAVYMAQGAIPFSPDWTSWELSMPAKYSVDIGRDSQNRREDVSVGIRAYSEILSEDGIDFRDHVKRRIADYTLAKAEADAAGVPLEWVMNPSGAFQNQDANDPVDQSDEPPARPQRPASRE